MTRDTTSNKVKVDRKKFFSKCNHVSLFFIIFIQEEQKTLKAKMREKVGFVVKVEGFHVLL